MSNMIEMFSVPLFEETLKDTTTLNKKMLKAALALEKKTKSKSLSNQFGFQSERLEPTLPYIIEFYEKVTNFITDSLANFKSLKKPLDVKFSSPWFNVNREKDFNWPHIHMPDESDFSLIYFLKTPKDCGKTLITNPAYKYNSFFDKTFTEYSNLNSRVFQIKPEESLIIMFPSDLEHLVLPNGSKQPRVSFAFDIKVT